MSAAATRFVGAITFTGLTGHSPVVDLWDPRYEGEVHVELAQWADVLVIAPATANVMARGVSGAADDALTATWLCFDGPTVLAPAMHTRMWERPATRRNAEQLSADGVTLVGPVDGPLASGDVGTGRLADVPVIADAVEAAALPDDLRGQRWVVSAGGTVEDLDPVRYLTNRSTGRMGYAIAERAARRGAEVALVAAPTALTVPRGVRHVGVRSALDMQAAIAAEGEVDVIVMAAAVADYRPADTASEKMKKGAGPMQLELVRNPDILAALGEARSGARPCLVGFALETENVVANARGKLQRKRVDLIVANHASESFGKSTNRVTLVAADGEEALPTLSKLEVADRIVDWVLARDA